MTNEEATKHLQTLIYALQTDIEGFGEDDEDYAFYRNSMEACNKAIAALRSQQEWIPCSDRLPEEHEADPIQKAQGIKKVSKRLLATIVTKFDKKPHVVEARTKGGNWYVDHVDLIKPYLGEVTAWMLMPEAYEP